MPVTCTTETAHYSSGQALLLAYATSMKQWVADDSSPDEIIYELEGTGLTVAEVEFIVDCCLLHNGDVYKACPRKSPCGNYGDLNNDGYVTQADADLIGEYLVGVRTLTEEQLRRADVYGDGQISVNNARTVARYALGYEDTFPVCARVTITFVTKKEDGNELTGVKVYINEIEKGET